MISFHISYGCQNVELANKTCSCSNHPLHMRMVTDLNSNFEGHFSDGLQRGVQSALSQMLFSNHVRNRLEWNQSLNFSFRTVNKFAIKGFCREHPFTFIMCDSWLFMLVYLCCSKENVIWDVANTTGDDSQCYSGEHISVVSLAREEAAPICQSDLFKGASAGKYAPSLWYIHMPFKLMWKICSMGCFIWLF